MGEEDVDGAHEDGQSLAGDGQGDGDGDSLVLTLASDDDDDGGDGGGKGGVGRHGGADVHPAHTQQLEGAADDNTGGGVAQSETGEGAGDDRTLVHALIQDGVAAG